jgi:hypothetical protein
MKLLHWALAGLLTLLVAACGGGDGAPGGAPAIQGFAASTTSLFVGERARLTATFTGGQGRIEPDIGPVTSGVPVDTPPLDGNRRYTLVVEAAGQPVARRELALAVHHRDRYEQLARLFRVQYHAATPTADGAVLIFGGSRGENTVSDAIDRFDPATRTFTRIGTLRTGRVSHTATRLPDGRVLVLGGGVSLDIGAVADLVDERTGAVSDGGRLQQTRHRHATVALDDGRVLVVGGWARNSVELWDPATNTFRLVVARMAHVREYPTATLLADGRVLIVGGYHVSPQNVFAEIFDPRSETFMPVDSPVDERRHFHQAHRQADGSVLIMGGEFIQEDRIVPLASVLRFDPASGTLAPVRAFDVARTLFRSVPLPDGQVLVFGGQTLAEGASATAVAYGADAVRPLASMPTGRAFHTATRMGDGRVLIIGGDDAIGNAVESVLIYE